MKPPKKIRVHQMIVGYGEGRDGWGVCSTIGHEHFIYILLSEHEKEMEKLKKEMNYLGINAKVSLKG